MTLRYIKIFIYLIAAYLLFGVVACLLPEKAVHHHIEQTVKRGELMWSDYPRAIINGDQAQMDNYTDALIISQVWNCSKDSLWESVMQPSRARYAMVMTEALAMQIEGKNFGNIKYGRYWHGSTFLMRFLLYFWSYNNIRLLFYILSSTLLLFTLWRIKERISIWASVITLLAFTLMYGYVMQFSIQFMPVLILSLAGILIMLDEGKDKLMACFVIGSLTAYFDLLTTPLLTIGIPLIAWVLVHRNDNQTLGKSILEMLKMATLWGVAFALTWGFKWLIATLTTDANILSDAMENVAYRSGELEDFTRFDAISQNLVLLNSKFIAITTIVMGLLMIFRFRREGWRPAVILIMLALVPYVWYFIVANHSYIHPWFTYRLQMITVMSLFAAFGCLIDWNRLKRITTKE
ncbi:MAG: hypothetical protein K6A67_05340 [Bacteroidales bacterium]|nr:hypothetical protein [Bacteroidales bacterium]